MASIDSYPDFGFTPQIIENKHMKGWGIFMDYLKPTPKYQRFVTFMDAKKLDKARSAKRKVTK